MTIRHPRRAAFLAAACLFVLLPWRAGAQAGAFDFHGLRMGMELPEITAAGYALRRGTDTPLSGAGWTVTGGLPPSLNAMTVYLFNHHLFQIDVTFPPVRGEAAVAYVLQLRERYGAPVDERFDPLRDAKWHWGGLTVHYSPGIRDDGRLFPNLLITDDALYERAREMKERPPEGRGL